jgi:predicted alpha/beta superfamily hydrolase
MKHLKLFVTLAFCFQFAIAQHKVKISIASLPTYHQPGQEIYMAGSFNGWNPGDARYKLDFKEGEYTIKMSLPAGAYEYKFTRGSWEKVETSADGKSVGNRELVVSADIDDNVSITGWQDHFPPVPKISTASKNVMILDTAFYVPQLNRYRRIWVYLPPAYRTGRRFPVLYMNDGQNLFDDSTSFSGEWGVDEFFDTTMLVPAIVVGIDNGGQYRLNEYSPYDMERYGKGNGSEYVDFIVQTLKPYIDRKYRTYRERRNTYIAGSSMGGLISMYAVLKYPHVFGGAGVFSPAFWVAPKIFEYIGDRGKRVNAKVYFYAGGKEGEQMVPDMLRAHEILMRKTKGEAVKVVDENGRHHEAEWRRYFPLFYQWLRQ